jgi:FlaA1/EpsC-like NDP-sugar epimerase
MYFNELYQSIITVFGGTGTIGKALVKELLKHTPYKIQVVSNNENELWESDQLFKRNKNIIHFFIDIRDYDIVDNLLINTDIVFNCAAIKHVPIAENFPLEAVKTNCLGLNNILKACEVNMVTKMIQISTDKAVEPSSVMGATKLIGERMVLNRNDLLMASVVRFGNVYGSRGSLVPIVERCLENGKKIPITDANMKRYFIKIEKAVEFIVNCADIMVGGEIFIPEMESELVVNIIDNIIKESGIPPSEVEFEYIGIRPGEKIKELLLTGEEANKAEIIKGGYVIK